MSLDSTIRKPLPSTLRTTGFFGLTIATFLAASAAPTPLYRIYQAQLRRLAGADHHRVCGLRDGAADGLALRRVALRLSRPQAGDPRLPGHRDGGDGAVCCRARAGLAHRRARRARRGHRYRHRLLRRRARRRRSRHGAGGQCRGAVRRHDGRHPRHRHARRVRGRCRCSSSTACCSWPSSCWRWRCAWRCRRPASRAPGALRALAAAGPRAAPHPQDLRADYADQHRQLDARRFLPLACPGACRHGDRQPCTSDGRRGRRRPDARRHRSHPVAPDQGAGGQPQLRRARVDVRHRHRRHRRPPCERPVANRRRAVHRHGLRDELFWAASARSCRSPTSTSGQGCCRRSTSRAISPSACRRSSPASSPRASATP